MNKNIDKAKQGEIRHPKSGKIIFGRRLDPGEIIAATDYASSSQGNWQPCEYNEGCTVGHDPGIIFVRPTRQSLI